MNILPDGSKYRALGFGDEGCWTRTGPSAITSSEVERVTTIKSYCELRLQPAPWAEWSLVVSTFQISLVDTSCHLLVLYVEFWSLAVVVEAVGRQQAHLP